MTRGEPPGWSARTTDRVPKSGRQDERDCVSVAMSGRIDPAMSAQACRPLRPAALQWSNRPLTSPPARQQQQQRAARHHILNRNECTRDTCRCSDTSDMRVSEWARLGRAERQWERSSRSVAEADVARGSAAHQCHIGPSDFQLRQRILDRSLLRECMCGGRCGGGGQLGQRGCGRARPVRGQSGGLFHGGSVRWVRGGKNKDAVQMRV